MKLRFFADHCVSTLVVESLKAVGCEIFRLRDFIPHDSEDHKVISEAQRLGAILITHNGDFADIVTFPPANYRGIIAIQARNHPEILPQLLTNLKDFLVQNPEMAFYQGKLLIAEVDRIRIRE